MNKISIRKLSYKTSEPFTDVPALMLAGRYLTEKYGWRPGDRVWLEYASNKIIIKKEGV